MPRNSSGNFTLASAAFVPGTIISSTAVNADLADIATAITQSLATTGVSSMGGVLKGVDGSVGAPGFTFASETTTGIYRSAPGTISLTGGGVQGLSSSSTTVTAVLPFTASGAATFSSTTTFSGTPTFNNTTTTFGGGAAAGFQAGLASAVNIGLVISNGPNVITTGKKGQINIPFPVTINSWAVMGEQSGSIVVDILRANNAVPTSSIVGGGNIPTLSSAQFSGANLSGWTASTLVANDWIDFNVTSATTVTTVTVMLHCTRTG